MKEVCVYVRGAGGDCKEGAFALEKGVFAL